MERRRLQGASTGEWHRRNVPICIFLYSMGSGLGYSTRPWCALLSLPEVVAVNEGSGNPRIYEDNVLPLSSLPSPVCVPTTNNEWWLADLALVGGDGILSGSGPVFAKEQVQIYRSVTSGDLRQAQEFHSARPAAAACLLQGAGDRYA
jgi:dihydrodipicolinate synthase/N-acetylneuraminate lyase